MTTLIDSIKRGWFFLSTILLVIFYYLYERRGQTISQLKADAQFALIDNKLSDIRARSTRSEEDFHNALNEYENLKRLHPELMSKLGDPNRPGGNS